ncbi:hypothetical protein OAL67_00550 [bacterium]|nr:hypothetical protein [bacterium]
MINLFGWLGKDTGSRTKSTVSQQTVTSIQQEWINIKTLVAGKSPSQLRQAIISADKTLDNALRDIVEGETMGERLKNAKDKFPSWEVYDKVWKAHKIRNNIVHESGYEPPYFVVQEAVESLRQGLAALRIYV